MVILIRFDGFYLNMEYDSTCPVDRQIVARAYVMMVKRAKNLTQPKAE
jgi:hypothetical protein